MINLPMGAVTFLFTDIEDWAKSREQYLEAIQAALPEQDAILKYTMAVELAFEEQIPTHNS